jgi:hypothetical protein
LDQVRLLILVHLCISLLGIAGSIVGVLGRILSGAVQIKPHHKRDLTLFKSVGTAV